jgi:SAM-dependent methyltransferase
MPGIEPIAWREMKSILSDVVLVGFRRFRDRNGIVAFEYRGDPAPLLGLRTVEDVFYLVAREKHVPLDRSGLRVLQQAVKDSRYFDVGLRIHRDAGRGRASGPTTFRVIARKQGAHHRYRRIDAQRAVEQGILQRYNYRWRLVEDHAPLEIWLTLLRDEALYGLRLSDRTMRHRTYKVSHLPASLRPTVAAAMVFLSEPQPDDVFLDPMCGAGTILIERALAGRHCCLLGGDVDPEAVATALDNIGPRYKPISVRHWDATSLPLEDGSVDKVVTNLPFGAQMGTHQHNVRLYPPFLRELERVMRPGGKLVALTSERDLLESTLSNTPRLHLQDTFNIVLLGRPATIHVVDRTPA